MKNGYFYYISMLLDSLQKLPDSRLNEDEDAAADGVTVDQLGLYDLFREINKAINVA